MRISDWSSDVCSSDLGQQEGGALGTPLRPRLVMPQQLPRGQICKHVLLTDPYLLRPQAPGISQATRDRKSTRLKLQSLMRTSYAVICLNNEKTMPTATWETNAMPRRSTTHSLASIQFAETRYNSRHQYR